LGCFERRADKKMNGVVEGQYVAEKAVWTTWRRARFTVGFGRKDGV